MKAKSTCPVIFFAVLLVAACKKDKEKQDCEIKNYGTIKVNTLYPSDEYTIEVNYRIKTINAGHLSDTMNVGPGAVVVEIFNKSKGDVSSQPLNIETCKEAVVNSAN
ncbi:MAG: hypothetical protein ABI675_12250 [Chitinophagaceae bacterium]